MTGSGSGAPGRDVTADSASGRSMSGQIVAVLVIGLVLRLIIAYLLPGSGFKQDLGAFQAWASNLADQGLYGFYQRDFFHDYTPGYLYVLWVVGHVGNLLGGIGDLVKVPAILADVALGWLAWAMARDLGVSERRATIGAAIVVLNPITWFDSVVWGQVDSVGVVFLLLAIRELWKGRTERSAVLAVVAALIKPQLGILAPIVAAVTIRRALWPAGGWGDEPAPAPSGLGWERRTTGWIRILTTGAAGFLTAVAMSAPFGLSLPGLIDQIFKTAAGYPYVSVNAYNAWALVEQGGTGLAQNGGWLRDVPPVASATDTFVALAGVPAVLVGGVLLGVAIVGVSLLVARRPDRLTIVVGVAILALAFFALPTRVHERYLFPLYALAAILAAFSWRWRIAYAVAAVATFLNMYVVLTTIYDNSEQGVVDWLGLGPSIRSWGWVAAIAVAHTAVLAWAFVQLRAGARARLAVELADAARDEPIEVEELPPLRPLEAPPDEQPAVPPWTPSGLRPAALTASAATAGPPAAPAAPAPRRRVPAWFDRPAWAELGPLEWLRARVTETPIRPDRSRELARERRGRLDRLDLWVVAVLVVASLLLRTFRLGEPDRMHFDEVYHARTAAEFLQDWRYGMPHTIYEWTHPHLAKYAMAVGIVLFAGHDVEATSNLGVAVRDVAIEPRRPDAASSARDGDRVWVATGSQVVGYDLKTRAEAARWDIPGASAVAFDPDLTTLYVGTEEGALLALDTSTLDEDRGEDPASLPFAPTEVARLGAPVSRLVAFDGGQSVGALLPGDTIAVVDVMTGQETGRTVVEGAADLVAAGRGDAIVATPADVADPAAVADELAAILGGEAADYRPALERTDADQVVLDGRLTSQVRTELQAAIDEGRLTGVEIAPEPWIAVAGASSVDFVTPAGTLGDSVAMAGGARGLTLVSGVDEGTQLWVTTTDATSEQPEVAIVAVSGEKADAGPKQTSTFPLPAAGDRIVYDAAAQLVEVVGPTPDGTGTTVYVIQPHGLPPAVFADHRLPFVPVAWALDTNSQYPSADRGQLLAFGADGTTAQLDVGHYAFAWRLPGVLAGALTAAFLYLLTRVLFRRREIAVLVGLFVLLDGMFFVQSRIAMNDVYVGMFIVAAYLVFARLWIEPERPRWAFWAGMPTIGLLLGLALASKWVAAYAIGALGILILARSALGRVILILGLIGLTGVLGWMAMAVPASAAAEGVWGNIPFILIMIGLTLAAVVVTVLHPIAWSDDEVRFAIGGPAALGILVAFGAVALGRADKAIALGPVAFTPLQAGLALVVLGLAVAALFALAGRVGLGPLAAPPPPDDAVARVAPPAPPATGWLRLGAGLGLPVAWMLGSLLAIPIVVYVISYLPWTAIEGHRLWDGFPAGNTGQTLLSLTGDMYRYHNNLTAAHAASSPWWAWPLDLKPVWFYQGGFANSTGAAIYDAGNLVIWWLGVPAMAFVAWQAFRRRSLGLALILIAFLCQWVSWARIDRAAFQYHYYTSLPFVVMALGYFVAEVWHGASRRTWLLARVAAATVLLGPVILWILKGPMCAVANVRAVNPGSQACGTASGNFGLTLSAAAIAVIAIVGAAMLVRILARVRRLRGEGAGLGAQDIAELAAVVVLGAAALVWTRFLPTGDPLTTIQQIVPEMFAIVVGIPLLVVALQLVTARDGRRFVAGLVSAVAIWFVFLYPNIAALPLPSGYVSMYQLLLPTYPYPFQFAVNTIDRSGAISFSDTRFFLLLGFLAVASAVVAYSAWVWRTALAEEAADRLRATSGPTGEPGPAR